jgi:ATP-dependent exoDNAse (exonuclease V) beta subunit
MRIGTDGRFGVRLSEPGTGKAEPALDFPALSDAQLRADQQEERRLFYVAMTRARERLILTGAAKLDAIATGPTPIAWIAPAFVPEIASPTEQASGVGEGGVAFTFVRPEDDQLPDPLPRPEPLPRPPLPGHDPGPQADSGTETDRIGRFPSQSGVQSVGALSYSALVEYQRCGYRFYAERVLGLPAGPGGGSAEPPGANSPPLAPLTAGGPNAAERGTLIHALLERLDFRRPRIPGPEEVIAAATGAGPSAEKAEQIVALLERFVASELCARLAAAPELRREQRFAFALKGTGTLVTGAFDVLAREREGLLIVDYKSDALGDRDPETLIATTYAAQRLIYALAALRSGARAVEVAHVFLEAPETPLVAGFGRADLAGLDARLGELASGVTERRFPVAQEPCGALCRDCPAEGGLCSWPLAMTRRESSDRLF